MMHTNTMRGLIGAKTNVELLGTPLRVYQEANFKGDTAKMEQAMSCMSDLHEEIGKYKKEADEGMRKDAEEAHKVAQKQQKEAIQKRKEEREKLEKRIEENRSADINTDTVEISEEGKMMLKDNIDSDRMDSDEIKMDVEREPIIYTKTGEILPAKQEENISVSV